MALHANVTDRTSGMSHMSNISFKDYVSTFSKDKSSKSPISKFYSDAIQRHREQMYSQMSEVTNQKKKIIHHLRISEEDIPIPKESKMRLGEILSKEQEVMKVGGGTAVVLNTRRLAMNNGRNENSGLVLRTLES